MIDINNIQQTNWADIRISILGAGKSGIAAANLGNHKSAKTFISDINDSVDINSKLSDFEHETGTHSNRILEADLIIISPGISNHIPIIQECRKQNIPVVSEIEFAFWFTQSPILAITGSNGKTTTVNLLHEMCLSDGRNSLLGGNVGIPFSENVLWELKTDIMNPVHVLEISSFQLEHIEIFSPAIAGILNISEDHMDRYDNMKEYARNKLNIAENITDSGWLIYNADDPLLFSSLMNKTRARYFSLQPHQQGHFKLNANKVYSGKDDNPDILFHLEDTKLKGNHNLQNILAAATMAHAFDISYNAIGNTITNFTPIPHRLEWIGNLNDVDYFDDSKATNIAAAKAAIESFDQNIILILGGQDKGQTDFHQLSLSIRNRVKTIITYGEAGEDIKHQLSGEFEPVYFKQFNQAVLQAEELAESGDTVLLSPACASYDQFENFEERGLEFKAIFNKLELGI